ncbi:hypothetical protein Ahy_A09g042806 isoform B [Arachis hypogaea]|uniref:Uncharacterized protein n=1 Tax=Arachis hypogaea TaxID=3818 RepID=A0A445BGT0_ARAHY|nr:hypothetical protein Ahy_A09g042806 isoform B [Arachis hypogaea]
MASSRPPLSKSADLDLTIISTKHLKNVADGKGLPLEEALVVLQAEREEPVLCWVQEHGGFKEGFMEDPVKDRAEGRVNGQ